MFIDLKTVCSKLLKSLVAEHGASDKDFSHMIKELKHPGDLVEQMLAIVCSSLAARPALLPDHLQSMMQQHYMSTWLYCENDTCPARTSTGSKPGIPNVDIMFTLAFTRANNLVRRRFRHLVLLSELPWSGLRTPQA